MGPATLTTRRAAINDAPLVASPVPGRDKGGGDSSWSVAARIVPVLVVVVAALFGLVLRTWLLAHLVLFGDEAVVGLMSQAIVAGHPTTFYWGQHYGGVEPYVVSALFKFSDGPLALNASAALLAGVATFLVAGIVKETTGNGRLAALAGALAWVWPYAAVWNSVREIGFRGATLCCGLVLVLCALKIHRGRSGPVSFVVLGVAAGLGWWASPEIVYFALPTAVLLVASWRRLFGDLDRPGGLQLAPVFLAVGGAVVGALPWIYTNARSDFASLRPGVIPPATVDYGGRLSVFFHDVLPMQLGVRAVPGGNWVGGNRVGPVLYAVAVVLVLAALARIALVSVGAGRRAAPLFAPALGVMAFPFLYSAFPTASAWVDGRYGVYLAPLIVVMMAAALAGPALVPAVVPDGGGLHSPSSYSDGVPRSPRGPRRRTVVGPLGLVGASLLVLASGATTAAAAHLGAGVPLNPAHLLSGWSDPDAPARQVVASMQAQHIDDAYGDYWTSYVLDFLAPGRVAVSPSPADFDRWPVLAARVAASPRPAWLFFAPGESAQAAQVFANPSPGPGGYTQAAFEALLHAQGVPYRVVHLGVLDAVLPAGKVTFPPPPPG